MREDGIVKDTCTLEGYREKVGEGDHIHAYPCTTKPPAEVATGGLSTRALANASISSL